MSKHNPKATKTHRFQDPSSNFAAVVVTESKLERDMLDLCKTLDDVQRCAEMGDFKITHYDLVSA